MAESVLLDIQAVLNDREIWQAEVSEQDLATAEHLTDAIVTQLGKVVGHDPMTARERGTYRVHDLLFLMRYLVFSTQFVCEPGECWYFVIPSPNEGEGLEVGIHRGAEALHFSATFDYGEDRQYVSMWKFTELGELSEAIPS